MLFFSSSFALFCDCGGHGSSRKLLNGFQSRDNLPLQGHGKLLRVNITGTIIISRGA